jgi:membrane protein DedA with SNARE-associated domain
MVTSLLEFLGRFIVAVISQTGYLGIVLLMAIESACIPLPSEVIMPFSGYLVSVGRFRLSWVALAGALGCNAGSLVAYYVGSWGGRPLVEKYGRYLLITRHDLEKADQWFSRWGDWAVFISRLLPIVRTFISFPAGVVRTRFWTFLIFTFVGSFLWCGALAWGGYVFGSRWEELRAIMRPFDIPVGVIIVGAGAYYVYRHVQHFRASSAAHE